MLPFIIDTAILYILPKSLKKFFLRYPQRFIIFYAANVFLLKEAIRQLYSIKFRSPQNEYIISLLSGYLVCMFPFKFIIYGSTYVKNIEKRTFDSFFLFIYLF